MTQAPSVLITDDDRGFRETLESIVAPLGVRTIQAENGLEALDIVQRERVHLVLLDMHMPRLTGLDTLRVLKQLKTVLPCILMSARLDEMIIKQAKLARACSVLSKPLTRRQITGAVCHALERAYNWQPGKTSVERFSCEFRARIGRNEITAYVKTSSANKHLQ